MTVDLCRQTEIHAQFAPWTQTVDLYLYNQGRDLDKPVRHSIQFKAEASPEYDCRQPSISLNQIAAQRLMDQLWNCGFRPTEGSGSAGSLAATQRHLEDMRTIAFKKLDIPNETTRASK